MAELEVLIDVQTGEALRQLGKLSNEFKDFAVDSVTSIDDLITTIKQLNTVRNSLKNTTPNYQEEIANLNKLEKQLQSTVDRYKAMGRGQAFDVSDTAKRSRIALNDLSRVVQDLPFGFIGIQNNIPQLINSFGQLKTETGSVAKALKGLVGGMIGPAGLFFAFSVITSVITSAIQKYGSLGGALDALRKHLKGVKDEIDVFKDVKAGNEVVEIRTLVNELSNVNKSYEKRNKALKELQDLYPTVFSNYKLDAAGLRNIAGAAKSLTDQLVAMAAVKKLSEDAAVALVNVTRGESKLESLAAQFNSVEKAILATGISVKDLKEDVGGANAVGGSIYAVGNSASYLTKKQRELREEYLRLEAERAKEEASLRKYNTALVESDGLIARLNDRYDAFDLSPDKIVKSTKESGKQVAKGIVDGIAESYLSPGFESSIARLGQSVKGTLEDYFRSTDPINLQFVPDLELITKNLPKPLTDKTNIIPLGVGQKQIEESAKLIIQRSKDITEAMENAALVMYDFVNPAFEAFFTTLFEGGENPFKALFNSLKQMVARFVAATVSALVLKAAIEALMMSVPGLNILAGLNKLSGFMNFGKGGGLLQQAAALNGLRGFMMAGGIGGVANLNGMTGGMGMSANNFTLSTTVRGQDLVFVMNRAGQTYGRTV